jgi:hypothetical protein
VEPGLDQEEGNGKSDHGARIIADRRARLRR